MFYLAHYFKTLLMKPLYALMWACSLFGLMFTLLFSKPLTKSITEITKVKESNPHFFAMIPSEESLGYLQRKLATLPGVKKVKKVSSQVLNKKINGLIGQLKDSDTLSDVSSEFFAIDVVMTRDLKVRSQNLIRDYLKRITSSKELTLGPIIQGKGKKKSNNILGYIKNYSLLIVSVLSFALYIFSNVFLLKELRKQSFLVENYQRKKEVFSKAFSSGQIPIMFALIIAMVMQNSVAYVLFITMLMSLLVVHILGKRTRGL